MLMIFFTVNKEPFKIKQRGDLYKCYIVMSSPPPCVFTLPLDSARMKTYLPVNFCRLSNKKKKADETSKKNYLRKILLVVSCNY